MQIMYKRKTQKTTSVDVNIFDEKKTVWFFSDLEIFKDKSRFAYDFEMFVKNVFLCEVVFSRTRFVD